MGIFDSNNINKQLPLEHLYKECIDICSVVIPKSIRNRDPNPLNIQRQIIRELERRNLWSSPYLQTIKANRQKICDVKCAHGGRRHSSPSFIVCFYHNTGEQMDKLHAKFTNTMLIKLRACVDSITVMEFNVNE
jgi:hypothetical protein